MATESFQPDKRTIGQILSKTSPPIRIPDYQRDFSWETEHVSAFWTDITDFGGHDPKVKLTGKEYFLGAVVLVNNGEFHLLLDGQQRLATATICLAALRDKMSEYNSDAAKQIQDQYIAFQDHLTGDRVFKLQLNTFDRSFFRDYVQAFPRAAQSPPEKKSHLLIQNAYKYFAQKLQEGWDKAGGGQKGFLWAAHVAKTLLEHATVIAVVSFDEDSAASIFATLNDRGIGLSTVDLIRSWVLQKAPATNRDSIIEYWSNVFEACGTSQRAEAFIRLSWVSRNGDVKTRSLHKVVTESLKGDPTLPLSYSRTLREDAIVYKQLREGGTDDDDLKDKWLALRTFRVHSGYALLMAAHRSLSEADQKALATALVTLVIRHNVVCKLDRAKLESVFFEAAHSLSTGAGYGGTLQQLVAISPSDEQFNNGFAVLAFAPSEHNVAQYLLRAIDGDLADTDEVMIAGPAKVHVEHIYPQSPKKADRWKDHDQWVYKLGNLTLLDGTLNSQISNGPFAVKAQAYRKSRLLITKEVGSGTSWNASSIAARQQKLCAIASKVWPRKLIP